MQKQSVLLMSRYHPIPQTGAFFWERNESPLPSSDIEFLHFHDCVEIGFCSSGHGIFAIGERFESIQPGDAVFVAPGVRHYSKSLDPCICHFVFITPSMLPDGFVRTDVLNRRLCAAQSQILRGEAAELCIRTAKAFMVDYDDSPAVERAAVLLAELSLMLSPSAQSDADCAAVRDSAAYDAAAYMKLHYAEPLKIAELAEMCHLSESRFRRRFAEEYGCTPYAYLYRLRAEIGAELLRRTQLTVSEVAASVGFGCDSEFYRCFVNAYGTAPSVWRKMQSDR